MKSFLEKGAKALIERQIKRPQSAIFRTLKTVQIVALVMCLIPSALIVFSNHVLKETPIHRFDMKVRESQDATFYGQIQQYMAVASLFMFNLPYLA